MMLRKVYILLLLGSTHFYTFLYAESSTLPPSLYESSLSWKDEKGASLTFANWKGKPAILAMGYTSCQKTCPIVVKKLKYLEEKLKKRSILPNILFVTMDPEVDKPEKLKEYKREQEIDSQNWSFLVGNENETNQLAKFLGFDFTKLEEHIVHNFRIFFISPQGNILETVTWEHASEPELEAVLQKLYP